MKTIAFFNEKGGVGKSSFSIMYASWLKMNGVKVAVADFNERITTYRNMEIDARETLRKEKPEIPPLDVNTTWPIVEPKKREIDSLKDNLHQYPYASWLESQYHRGGPLEGYDVIVCDFPGSLSGSEVTDLIIMDLLSYVAVPTEIDPQTKSATIQIHKLLCTKGCEVNHSVFLNKANLNLPNLKSIYFKQMKNYIDGDPNAKVLVPGLPMLPDIITYSERMMKIETVSHMRSTFYYPNFDLPEFGDSKDHGIGNLFIDVTRELVKSKDIKGTGKADLSFINGCQKRPDKRQYPGSSFPEYEI